MVDDPLVIGDLGGGAVVDDDEPPDVRHLVGQRPQHPEQRPLDEDHLVVGVVDDVDELLGEEPDVERVQHPAGAGHGEVQLEVHRGVPAEGADPGVVGDPELLQRGRGAAYPLRPVRVGTGGDGPADTVAGDRFVTEHLLGPVEHVGQGERPVLHLSEHGRAFLSSR